MLLLVFMNEFFFAIKILSSFGEVISLIHGLFDHDSSKMKCISGSYACFTAVALVPTEAQTQPSPPPLQTILSYRASMTLGGT